MISLDSLGYLVFVAVLLPVWYRTAPARRWLVLLAASGVFFLSLDPFGLAVLLLAALAVWWAAPRAAASRLVGAAGILAALAPLLLIKYLGFGPGQLYQPLGIGYYTLLLVSYLVDTARGGRPVNYARLVCYAGCFLSITQGPFTRCADLMAQLQTPTRWDSHRAWRGAMRMAWGYFKKLAVADRAGVVVNAAFANPVAFDRSQLLFAAVLYSFQLYADFSGYTDIVLGTAELLGLNLPENFRQPFLSASVHELWSRWHISLGRWLRDYVYIPLGGNRKGVARRDLNLVLTFLVSGIWHGAGATYLIWGGVHGLIQAGENHLPRPRRRLARLGGIVVTFCIFVVTFTLFRATSLSNAADYFGGILRQPGSRVFANYWELGLTSRLDLLLLLAGVGALIAVDLLHEAGAHLRDWVLGLPTPARWAVYQGSIFAFLLMGSFLSGGGFLYVRY